MLIEVPVWAVLAVVGAVLVVVALEAGRAWLLREAIQERDAARQARDKIREELPKLWLEIAALKAAKPGVESTKLLPSVADGEAKLAAAMTEIRAHTAVVRATTAAEREAAGLAVVDGPDVTPYLPAQEPMHDAAELERLQPLAYVVAHGQRERREAPPPIQPEPVLPVEAVTEVLEPVEVPEGDDDPPQDEARIIRRGEDEPPQGGRALTPFGPEGPPPGLPYRHVWTPQPSPWPPWRGVLPDELPRRVLTELTRQWRWMRHRGPIEIKRLVDPASQQITRIRAEVAQRRAEWGREPGTHRRRDYIGGHRGLA